ncbi:MAG: restriction endonuclease subunit S, partial [Clostridiales bacterium]|nr:restriction endonuclease subunit S [Clostridiales bacterium]
IYYWMTYASGRLRNRGYARHYVLLKEQYIPLPPLAEQKRIVAKIEEMLPYIDRYEQAWSKLEDFNKRFPTDMQKSILQTAIQGKLVEQRHEEGTAEELYKQIQTEKQRLIKAGTIKKEKHLPEITEDEKLFDIPDSWKWVYIGDLFQHNTGKGLNASDKLGTPLEYITTSNVYWNRFELDKLKTMLFTDAEIERCSVQKGELLVLEGGDIGRAAIWNYDFPMRIQNHIHRLRPYDDICIEFFYHIFFLNKNAGFINGKGIGIKRLSANALHKLVIPLPPLAEQKRIVAKLEEILPLCDKLK